MTSPTIARARLSDPDVSHLAAASVNVPRSHRLVLDALRMLGPATAERVEDHLRDAVSPSRARSALKDGEPDYWITDQGKPEGLTAELADVINGTGEETA